MPDVCELCVPLPLCCYVGCLRNTPISQPAFIILWFRWVVYDYGGTFCYLVKYVLNVVFFSFTANLAPLSVTMLHIELFAFLVNIAVLIANLISNLIGWLLCVTERTRVLNICHICVGVFKPVCKLGYTHAYF